MSTYNPKRLLTLWMQEKVTQAQATGYLIQHLIYLHQQISDLLTLLHYYDRDLALLYDHLGLERASKKMKPIRKADELDEGEGGDEEE